MKRSLNLITAVLLTALLGGCVAYGEAYIPAPPPLQAEVITVAPYPEAVWVPGYWNWERRDRKYNWVQGHWRGREEEREHHR